MEKFPTVLGAKFELGRWLTRSGTERWPRGEGARAHAEARAERGRDIAEEVAAAGAVAVVGSGNGDISAHPLTTSFAKRIDALHGEAGQVLHFSPSEAAKPGRPLSGRA